MLQRNIPFLISEIFYQYKLVLSLN